MAERLQRRQPGRLGSTGPHRRRANRDRSRRDGWPVGAVRETSVGALGWARRSDGLLRPRDRVRLLGQAVLAQGPELVRQLSGRLGLRPRRLRHFDLDALRIPDSAPARAAEQLCAEMRPELLVHHSYRTYVWATLIGAYEGARYDEEVLYVSSLLHDLGLSKHGEPRPAPSCFTLVGADACQRIGQSGWDSNSSSRAAEAITMHMNLRVCPADGAEAHLLTAGTQLDVIGSGYWRIAPETVARVMERYPRRGVKDGMAELFRGQALAHAGTRAHFYWRYLGLPLLLRASPFDE